MASHVLADDLGARVSHTVDRVGNDVGESQGGVPGATSHGSLSDAIQSSQDHAGGKNPVARADTPDIAAHRHSAAENNGDSLPNSAGGESVESAYDVRTTAQVQESLRRDINAELEDVGEKAIPSARSGAEDSSLSEATALNSASASEVLSTSGQVVDTGTSVVSRESIKGSNSHQKDHVESLEDASFRAPPPSKKSLSKHSPKSSQSSKGFGQILQKQSLFWDEKLRSSLKSSDPWTDLSGGRGPYAEPGRSGHVRGSVEMWAHKDVRASRGFKFPFCRLFRACRTKSGKLLLPKDLEQHKADLAKCGILGNTIFALGDKELESRYEFVAGVGAAKTAHMDLIERHAPRRGAIHFLADSLKLLFFIDVIHGSGATVPGVMYRQCYDSHGKRVGACSAESPSDVHPVTFIRKESFIDETWVPHFMKLLSDRKAVRGRTAARFLNQYDLYTAKKAGQPEQAACFRSITTSAYMYGQIPSSALTSANPFFSGNGIERDSISRIESKSPGSEEQVCRLRVKLSDHITGVAAENLNKIALFLKEKTSLPPKNGLQVALMLVLPAQESVAFSKQMERMTSVDVLVAPHGSAMNDVIFMRQETHAIELLPFSFHSGMFQGITHQLGVSHSKVSAEPDIKMIEMCLARFNKGPEAEAQLGEFLAKLEATAEEFKKTGTSSIHMEGSSKQFPKLLEIKQCARKQRSRFDPQKVADEIWRVSEALCGNQLKASRANTTGSGEVKADAGVSHVKL